MELNSNVWEYFRAVDEYCNTIEFTYDKKNSLYIPLFTASIEHSFSIHILDKEELTVSAFALARPMVESYLRAMWVKHYLHEDKIIEGCEQLHFPKKLDVLLDNVDSAVLESDRFRGFKSSIEPVLTNMHDFTHGGVQSIARQYGHDGHLSNQRSRQERDELLKLGILTSSLSFESITPYMKSACQLSEVIGLANKLIKL